MTPSDNPIRQDQPVDHDRRIPCEEIRAQMLDYVQRDLGEGRSDLIREHVRRCPACQENLDALRRTMDILHDAPFGPGTIPEHLSERHRSRLMWSLMHPVLDWVYVHHILVSALVATIVLASVFFGLRRYKVWRETIDQGIPVVIGQGEMPE